MKKIIAILTSLFLIIESISLGFVLRENDKLKENDHSPTPLVIDNGIHKGFYPKSIIMFHGDGVASKRYEGAMKVEFKGDTLFVTCGSDVIEENILEE